MSTPARDGLPTDGLFPPYNAPGAAAVSPGVQPGTSSAIDLAQYVVIFGNTGGMFVYAGTPVLGNPPVYSICNANVDPYGNHVLPGIWSGTTSTAQAGFQVSGTQGNLFFIVPGTFAGDVALFAATGSPGGSTFEIQGAADPSPDNDNVIQVMYSSDARFGYAAMQTGYFGPSGAFLEFFFGNYSGTRLATVNALFAVLPGTGTDKNNIAQPESWHTITMDSGWSALAGYDSPRYRILPDGSVQFSGSAQFTGTPGNPQNLNSSNPLPAAYRPANNHYFRSGDLHRMGAQYNFNGVIQGFPVSGGFNQIAIDGVVSNQ